MEYILSDILNIFQKNQSIRCVIKARYTLGTCNIIPVFISSIIKFKTSIGVLSTRICKIIRKTKFTLRKTLNSRLVASVELVQLLRLVSGN